MIIIEVEGGVVVAVFEHNLNNVCEELVVGKDYKVDDHDNGECKHKEYE